MSQIEVDKVIPQSGTALQVGEAGDTVNIVGTLQNNGAELTGDISSVVAGTGLAGGGTTGDVTLNVEAAQPTITSTGTLTSFRSTGIDDNSNALAMTIDSSERVLVGKTAEERNNAGLELNPVGKAVITRSGGTTIELNRKSSDGDLINFFKDNTGVGSIGSYSNDLYLGTTDTGLKFNDFGDYITPFNPSTLAERDNAIGLGTSSSRFKDLFLGGGAFLGGTGIGNKLDDYEEGTWTPVINNSGVAELSMTNNGANYTKIGRMVYVTATLRYTGSTVSSGATVIGAGLPFTAASGSPLGCSGTFIHDPGSGNSNYVAGICGANAGTNFYFIITPGGRYLDKMYNNYYFQFAFNYRV